MATLIDYVRSCQDGFAERGVCRVDALVLSWLSNLRFSDEVVATCTTEGVALGALDVDAHTLGLVAPVHDWRHSEELLRACCASPRFSQLIACRAKEVWSREAETQFFAMTFLLPDDLGAFVAFRGTDDTLVGWKENFNMAFDSATGAQEAARTYLEEVAGELRCPLWIGGHSKGGNLALYAAATCDPLTRLRLEAIYCLDSPGVDGATGSVGGSPALYGWQDAVGLVERVIVEESVVGLLLWETRDVKPFVVRSAAEGLSSHAALSWMVEGTDFVPAGALSYDAYVRAKRFSAWLAARSKAERERFVEILYKLAQASGEVTLSGLMKSVQNGSLDLMLRRFDGLAEDDRTFFAAQVDDLVATLLLGPAPVEAKTPAQKVQAAQDKVDDYTARFDSAAARLEKYL